MWIGWILAALALTTSLALAQDANGPAPSEAPFVQWLNGEWSFAPAGSDQFDPLPVPGTWVKSPQLKDFKAAVALPGGIYRRPFTVPEGIRGAALEFDAIRWGGEVLVNGQSLGKTDLAYSPLWLDASAAVRPGVNQLEVRPRGWTSLERFETGDVQIPSGAGHWFGDKSGGIPGDVSLRFYRGARIGAIRISPRIAGPACDVEVELLAPRSAWQGQLSLRLLDDAGQAVSSIRSIPVSLTSGQVQSVIIKDVAAPGAALWSPQRPALHQAVLWLQTEGSSIPASVRTEHFGFREIVGKDGHLWLNGQRLALHGYTGVWVYGDFDFQADEARVKAHQVTLFKAMSGRAFRSHMDPLPRKWLDVCDRYGILAFPELPNFPDIQRQPNWSLLSPYDRPAYWQNLQRDITGIIKLRANHPSIVGWSASNEGNGFGDWERANLFPFVKKIDPTRPVLFSSDVTPDIADTHMFMGNWYGTPAEFDRAAETLARHNPDRPLGCTEFGQFEASALRFGPAPNPAEARDRDQPQLLMEQIESLRRNRFDLIMPYCVPVNRRTLDLKDVPPTFHAMRNALAPLGVSLAWPNRHAAPGSRIEVPVWVLSDDNSAAGAVHVEVVLLKKHPGFDWDGNTDGRLVRAQANFDLDLKPWAAEHQTVTLALPDEPGDYTLAAVARTGSATTLSLRPLRLIAPPAAPGRPLNVGVIEKDGRLAAWLTRRGHRVVLPYGEQRPDVIMVSEGQLSDARLRNFGFAMSARVKQGVRLVVLEQQAWNPGAFTGDVLNGLEGQALRVASAWAFPQDPGITAAISPTPGELNGCDGIALRVRLQPAGTGGANPTAGTGQPDAMLAPTSAPSTAPGASAWRPLMLTYTRGLSQPDWAIAQGRYGQGDLLTCQVPLLERIDPAGSGYDPLAESLLAWLIEGK